MATEFIQPRDLIMSRVHRSTYLTESTSNRVERDPECACRVHTCTYIQTYTCPISRNKINIDTSQGIKLRRVPLPPPPAVELSFAYGSVWSPALIYYYTQLYIVDPF